MANYTGTTEAAGTSKPKMENTQVELAHPRPWCGAGGMGGPREETEQQKVYNYGSCEEKEKTPMCRIAELCRFYKIKHEYRLMDESGPAHKKMFTVQLVLSEEERYEGVGGSIKKAQQSAATNALKHTTREFPITRNGRGKKKPSASSSPCVLLMHAIRRLGLADPVYNRIEFNFPPNPRFAPPHRNPMPPPQRFVPWPGKPVNFNGSQPPPTVPIPHLIPPLTPFSPMNKPPCLNGIVPPREVHVTLQLGAQYPLVHGAGPSFSQAQSHCAMQALMMLGPSLANLDLQVKEPLPQEQPKVENGRQDSFSDGKENREEETGSEDADSTTPKQKSVVSRLHECALQLKLNVAFELLAEEGPAHSRHFVVRCILIGNNNFVLSADGEGQNKKTAKQAACAAVLAKCKGLENSPLYIAQSIYKIDRKNAQPKDHKRKTILKDKKMDPEYGHQINPVSRLMQVVQTKGESEPHFECVREQGQNRYKEFIVEVTWGELQCTGSGPNKRLAKRAAAEKMLSEIGFVKPMPPPGKSLLKRRSDDGHMSIGVFDPEEAMKNNENKIEEEKKEEVEKEEKEPVDEVQQETREEGEKKREGGEKKESTKKRENGNSKEEGDKDWEIVIDTDVPLENWINGSPHSSTSDSTTSVANSPTMQTRRVTFNNQVKACPPPDDVTYPMPQIAPLKTDVVIVGKLSRRKGRDGKRVLTTEQKTEIQWRATEFLKACSRDTKMALVPAKQADCSSDSTVSALQMETSRRRLEMFSEMYKFNVTYSNFPQEQDQYFVLVSLGLEKPLVCHGAGVSIDSAADDAAYNALETLAKMEV